MSKIHHSNVLALYGTGWVTVNDEMKLALITEFCEGGNLSTWLHGYGFTPKRAMWEKWPLIWDFVQGMSWLHGTLAGVSTSFALLQLTVFSLILLSP
jgi:hypothetical protein